jgi:hypothetical protein
MVSVHINNAVVAFMVFCFKYMLLSLIFLSFCSLRPLMNAHVASVELQISSLLLLRIHQRLFVWLLFLFLCAKGEAEERSKEEKMSGVSVDIHRSFVVLH